MIGWLAAVASAAPLFVPDEERRQDVWDALQRDWPEHDLVVEIGSPPASGGYLAWDGATVWDREGDAARSAPAPDAVRAVLLLRTWRIHGAPLATRYVPPVPAPPPAVWLPAAPAPVVAAAAVEGAVREVVDLEAPAPAPTTRPWFAVGVGTGLATATPGRLDELRMVVGAGHGETYGELSATAWLGQDDFQVARWTTGRWLGERVTEVPLDAWRFDAAVGWRRRGRVPWGFQVGPELRVVQWWLVIDGVVQDVASPLVVPALTAGPTLGLRAWGLETRLLAWGRVSTAPSVASAGVAVDLLFGSPRR